MFISTILTVIFVCRCIIFRAVVCAAGQQHSSGPRTRSGRSRARPWQHLGGKGSFAKTQFDRPRSPVPGCRACFCPTAATLRHSKWISFFRIRSPAAYLDHGRFRPHAPSWRTLYPSPEILRLPETRPWDQQGRSRDDPVANRFWHPQRCEALLGFSGISVSAAAADCGHPQASVVRGNRRSARVSDGIVLTFAQSGSRLTALARTVHRPTRTLG